MLQPRKVLAAGAVCLLFVGQAFADTQRWSAEKAHAWYATQRWLVGSNYIPRECDQPARDVAGRHVRSRHRSTRSWAGRGHGHEHHARVPARPALAAGRRRASKRIDQFLSIAAKHGIKPLLVLFDSCWDPNPKLGPQRPPIPGVHNSGWVQGPGRAGLADPLTTRGSRRYVKDIVARFRQGRARARLGRVERAGQRRRRPAPTRRASKEKFRPRRELLPQVFAWARAAKPTQPLTRGVWHNEDWSPAGKAQSRREHAARAVRRHHLPHLRRGRKRSSAGCSNCRPTAGR